MVVNLYSENDAWCMVHLIKSGSFPRIEEASGNVSEQFDFHCQLAYA